MPRTPRHRAASVGSQLDHDIHAAGLLSSGNGAGKLNLTRQLLDALLRYRDRSGQTLLSLSGRENVAIPSALFMRLKQLELLEQSQQQQSKQHSSTSAFTSHCKDWLLAADLESGYTAMHSAVYQRDLALILLYLRHAASAERDSGNGDPCDLDLLNLIPPRLSQRALNMLLLGDGGGNGKFSNFIGTSSKDKKKQQQVKSSILSSVLCANDAEGLSPGQLLAALQRSDLYFCRKFAIYHPGVDTQVQERSGPGRRRRTLSDLSRREERDEPENEQNEFDLLSRGVAQVQRNRRQSLNIDVHDERTVDTCSRNDEFVDDSQERVNHNRLQESKTMYGCEVFSFGSAQHCALGQVGGGAVGQDLYTADKNSSTKTLRPQRVPAFGTSVGGPTNRAVAIAAAAHHTLVVTSSGHLYAFGLGRGGRLGLGDNVNNVVYCPLPRRVLGPLLKRRVVTVAAAENHSLCVTSGGAVYAFGSNGFGQLGLSSTIASTSEDTSNKYGDSSSECSRSFPRLVEGLKNVFCVAVAAGARHSVVLSRSGEVFVFGDNSSGQLGVARRNGAQKVQRVEALWSSGNTGPKIAIAIAAADYSTLVLIAPPATTGALLPTNSIYSFGHGVHVPSRVNFDQGMTKAHSGIVRRVINPVAIACARYHNVAITADGLVYSWGFHSDPLGVASTSQICNKSTKIMGPVSSGRDTASPQLVTGMLTENGGGFAVAVSASENHSAILTDTGALFTWGSTYGKNILGHEGVSWQPAPKRVPGVCRAVAVSVAKEHTVLLIGTTFPPIPLEDEESTLDSFAVREIAKHVDLFTALPVLITAERIQSPRLVDFCLEFIRRNLDGVLCVAQKLDLDIYLNEQLVSFLLKVDENGTDTEPHPLLFKAITAGNEEKISFRHKSLSPLENWRNGCEKLAETSVAQLFVCLYTNATRTVPTQSETMDQQRLRSASASSHSETQHKFLSEIVELRPNHYVDPTPDSDFVGTKGDKINSTSLQMNTKSDQKQVNDTKTVKEVIHDDSSCLVHRNVKIACCSQLGANYKTSDLIFEKAGQPLRSIAAHEQSSNCVELPLQDFSREREIFRCEVCEIRCPDEMSFALHMSGRKHRNRVSQIQDEEEKIVAASITKNQQLKMLQNPVGLMQPEKTPYQPAWRQKPSVISPKYQLPPPPHPVPDIFVSVSNKRLTLKEIMLEESQKAAPKQKAIAPSKPELSLELPIGSASTLKFPPWASAPVLSTSPLKKFCSTDDVMSLNSNSKTKPMSPTPTVKKSPAWSPMMVTQPSPTVVVSLSDIQKQELDLKSRANPVFDAPVGGKGWFQQRCERAGSLLGIQEQDKKDREERLFIEEQFRIEKLILEEVAIKNDNKTKVKGYTRPVRKGGTKQPNPDEKQKRLSKKRNEGGKKRLCNQSTGKS